MRDNLRRSRRLHKLDLPRLSNKHNEHSTIVSNADTIRYILRSCDRQYYLHRVSLTTNGPVGSKVRVGSTKSSRLLVYGEGFTIRYNDFIDSKVCPG